MKLLLDQHFSQKLVSLIDPLFPGSTHVQVHGLDLSSDLEVWAFAKAGGYAILTKDDDFRLISFTRGHPPKVIWLRSGNGPTREVFDILKKYYEAILAFGMNEDQSLLMLK